MKAIPASGLALAAMLLCGGCETDFYAKQIVQPNTDRGKQALWVTGTGKQLIMRKQIDLSQPFSMPDGTEIDVWVIKARPPEGEAASDAARLGTALLLHDLRESKAFLLDAGRRLAKRGYDVVLPDLRAHGRSTGTYVTYGTVEKQDLKRVMDLLINAGSVHADVYVLGIKFGAVTGIQYAAIDPRCKGIVAIAPFRDAASEARRMIFPLAPAMSNQDFEKVLARAGQLANFDPHLASSERAAASITCPLLIAHGMFSVPPAECQAIHDAARGPKKLQAVAPLPGPEQMRMLADYQGWLVDKLHHVATKSLAEAPPATQPAGGL